MPPEGELSAQTGVTGVGAKKKKSSDASVSNIGIKEVQVDDKLYSATGLASIHPGGQMFVRAFAGSDATEAFMSYHRRQFPHSKYATHLVGSTVARKTLEDDKDYLELCHEIQKVLPTLQSFAPWHYFVKVVVLLGVAVYLEYYMHVNKAYTLALSSLIGWVYALVGLNIQHDANHGAISRYGLVNRLLGLSQNWIGGSATDWIHQHVVQHHVNTNDVDHDPDMLGSDVLRINPTKERYSGQAWQHLYVFALLALFGINYIFSGLVHLLKGQHLKHMSKLLWSYRIFDICTWAFFMARWAVYPVYQTGSYMPLLTTLPMYCVGGYYLAFFFIISHNFVGADMLDSKEANSPKSFLYKQIATSSNVGGAFLAFINGGLNYQIEHHLFPRMSHTHYPTIAPLVRDFCEKKNIPYVHFPTVADNMGSCCQHLYNMGNNDKCSYNSKKKHR